MRKQNHPTPPAPEHEGRLINSTIPGAKYKRPNALKHGVYATPALIPGENRQEFEELLAELLDEYKPLGPSLRHAVHCLADSMWRLRRLKKSVQTELYQNSFEPHNPVFDEAWVLDMFIHNLPTNTETCFENNAKKSLRRNKIKYIGEKFPPADYESTAEWVNALIGEILSTSVAAKPQFEAP